MLCTPGPHATRSLPEIFRPFHDIPYSGAAIAPFEDVPVSCLVFCLSGKCQKLICPSLFREQYRLSVRIKEAPLSVTPGFHANANSTCAQKHSPTLNLTKYKPFHQDRSHSINLLGRQGGKRTAPEHLDCVLLDLSENWLGYLLCGARRRTRRRTTLFLSIVRRDHSIVEGTTSRRHRYHRLACSPPPQASLPTWKLPVWRPQTHGKSIQFLLPNCLCELLVCRLLLQTHAQEILPPPISLCARPACLCR